MTTSKTLYMSKEDVISEYVTRALELKDTPGPGQYEMTLTSMYNEWAAYSKEEVKARVEAYPMGDDLIIAAQSWDLSTEEEG
jgi:hypothetical protein